MARRRERAELEAVAGAVRLYHEDLGWLDQLGGYAGLEREAMRDLLGCFFAERAGVAVPAALPEWARRVGPEQLEARRAQLCRAHGWEPGMPLRRLAHYEIMAREVYKLPLHREWLASLNAAIRPGQAFRLLDYGCGVGSFAELALGFVEVHCTFADMDAEVIRYLEWKHREHADRVHFHALAPSVPSPAKRARVPVSSESIAGRFDAVVLADVLEHTLDPLRVLRHLLSQVRPGGLVFVNYPREIEGDWHTPEAYWLRRWCFALLRACARRGGPHTWIRREARHVSGCLGLARLLNPWLYRRATAFARAYFRRHGSALSAKISALGERSVTAADLLDSVVDWPCSDASSAGSV